MKLLSILLTVAGTSTQGGTGTYQSHLFRTKTKQTTTKQKRKRKRKEKREGSSGFELGSTCVFLFLLLTAQPNALFCRKAKPAHTVLTRKMSTLCYVSLRHCLWLGEGGGRMGRGMRRGGGEGGLGRRREEGGGCSPQSAPTSPPPSHTPFLLSPLSRSHRLTSTKEGSKRRGGARPSLIKGQKDEVAEITLPSGPWVWASQKGDSFPLLPDCFLLLCPLRS